MSRPRTFRTILATGALPPDDDRLAVAVPGDVARDDHVSLRLEAPLGCAGRVAEGDDCVVQVVGEPAEDAADVQGVAPAPLRLAVGDVVRGGHAWHGEPGDVGDVARADTDSVVQVPLRVVGVVEGPRRHERIAGHEDQGGVETPEGVDVGPRDGVGLRDDDHQVGGVESLEIVRRAGGEADGEGLVVDLIPGGPEDAAPQAVRGARVGGPDLPPQDVVDLARGRAGDYGLGGRVRVEPPEDGPGGGPVLA